jgi:hypothetical protein
MEQIATARLPFYEAERRRHFLILLAILMMHSVLIFGWSVRKRAAPGEELPSVLPIWNIPVPQKKPEAANSEIKPASKTVKHTAPLHPGKPLTPVEQPHDVDSPSAPIVPAPAPAASATPRLDYGNIRNQALEIDRNREISPIDKLRQEQFKPHTVESGIQQAAKRGTRGDCQTEYAGMGLLAIVPLLVDTVTDRGCKWK